MPTRYADRHLHQVDLARQCVALGGRYRTVELITGLSHSQLLNIFRPDRRTLPRGRAPDSPEWYYRGNLLDRIDASVFAASYRRHRLLQFEPAHSLIGGYRRYISICGANHRLNFDRAFDLAGHIEGIWVIEQPQLALASCPVCGSHHISVIGDLPLSNAECPFCKLVRRYDLDQRIQSAFPAQPQPNPSSVAWSAAFLSGILRVTSKE
ncbi:MAG: hypothetical protein EKK45_03185 [Curvibacter sp.]|jgi:flagellar transcriptional activator FlhC|nr:MAG: hypothetical protein EKK45_03185 [Curvibacter sp.]